jgi:hypothetical protein
MYIPGKKTLDLKGYLVNQEFYEKYPHCEYGALGFTPIYKIHINRENNLITGVDISNNICRQNFEKLTILQGKIWNIQVNLSYFYFLYDNNRLVKINQSRNYEFYGKGDWRKNYYTFEYFSSGKIKSIKYYVSIGVGEHIENIKELYAYIQEERHYFENDSTKVRILRYVRKQNKDDNDLICMDITIESKQQFQKEEFVKINNLKAEPTIKYTTELNPDGKVFRNSTIENNSDSLDVSLNSYDSKGLLNKTIHKAKSRYGNLVTNTENIYNYTLKQNCNPDDQCSYKSELETKSYNMKGELTTEIKNGKVRTKKTNGEWGPWVMQY